MPAKDFKKGQPRPGQWVWVEKDQQRWLGIAVGPDHGHYVTTKNPITSEIVVQRFPPQGAVLDFKGRPGFFCIAIVDEETGTEDAAHILVHLDRLTPVVKLEDIPAKRRATMNPNWVPLP